MLLPIILEKFSQSFSCEKNPAFDCSQWHIETFRDFLILIAGNVHREWIPVIGGEAVENRTDLTGCIRTIIHPLKLALSTNLDSLSRAFNIVSCTRSCASSSLRVNFSAKEKRFPCMSITEDLKVSLPFIKISYCMCFVVLKAFLYSNVIISPPFMTEIS